MFEPTYGTLRTAFQPAVDLAETEADFRVVAEVPGVKREDITITLEGKTLTISGEKKEFTETKEENDGLYHCERRYGKFVRTFMLPERVDPKRIAAAYKDGVLEVMLPKVAEARPQKIQITAK